MILKTSDIAKMYDLSCVRMHHTREDMIELIDVAKKYSCGQVSVLQCFLDMSRELLLDRPDIKLVGNVSFPSGSDDYTLKRFQADQMFGKCDEIDMVMNVNWLKSGMYKEVEADILAVREVVKDKTLKVIIESPILDDKDIAKACEICINAKADFVKTGTGWTDSTTVEQVKFIKSVVGDAIAIKASGGVADLGMLAEMYQSGATRFGVNLATGIAILEECDSKGGSVEV